MKNMGKKSRAIVFGVIILLLSFVVVQCEADIEDKIIQFRGLQWGCSVSEVNEILIKDTDLGIEYWTADVNTGWPIESQNNLHSSWVLDYYKHDCTYGLYPSWTSFSFNVAGYTVGGDGIMLKFACTKNSDGVIDINNEDNTALYYASYKIQDISDPLKTYEDLIDKISSMYGKPITFWSEGEASRTSRLMHIAEWEGADNTKLYLVVSERIDFSGKMIYYAEINYNWLDGYTLVEEADKILAEQERIKKEEEEKIKQHIEEENFGNGNTNGL